MCKSLMFVAVLLTSFACETRDVELSVPRRSGGSITSAEVYRPDVRGTTVEVPIINQKMVFDKKGDYYSIGDMVFTQKQVDSFKKSSGARTGLRGLANNLWWDQSSAEVRIPYTVGSSIDQATMSNIIQPAINHWFQQTTQGFSYIAVRLVPRTNETDYVEFVSGSGCSSYVGRIGGRQEITIGPLCQVGNAIHEIGHAVGLFHEHQRVDRDSYVIINFNNIIAGYESNFYTYAQLGRNGFEFRELDFDSVMMYGSDSFQRSSNSPTITRTDGSTFNVQRNGLSPGDVDTAFLIYNPYRGYL